jgi:hypothetical protein
MTDKQTAAHSSEGNTEKDPADWVTGDEPMTGAQKSYLKTLSEEAKVDFDASLNEGLRPSKRIECTQRLRVVGGPKPAGLTSCVRLALR